MQTQSLKIKNISQKSPHIVLGANGREFLDKLNADLARRKNKLQEQFIYPALPAAKSRWNRLSVFLEQSENRAKIKKYIFRIAFTLIALNAVALVLMAARLYTPLSPQEQISIAKYWGVQSSSAAVNYQIGTKGTELVTFLKNIDPNAAAFAPTIRKGLSGIGHLISVDGDTVAVFEYQNAETAKKEAGILAATYSKNVIKNSWDNRAYIYQKDTLIIFYLGTRESIPSVLTAYAGDPLNQKLKLPHKKSPP